MVKLNNRGFGMTTMLIFIGIFIIVLIAIMMLADLKKNEKKQKQIISG